MTGVTIPLLQPRVGREKSPEPLPAEDGGGIIAREMLDSDLCIAARQKTDSLAPRTSSFFADLSTLDSAPVRPWNASMSPLCAATNILAFLTKSPFRSNPRYDLDGSIAKAFPIHVQRIAHPVILADDNTYHWPSCTAGPLTTTYKPPTKQHAR